ncbi:serine/threonine-protein kinase [Brooklawnia propionicigenes]|uniref:serine/threonine-protein kinase n=1 Tax=Brooklawnia propionicigenes TaxID=3041175 RepID=UPI002574282D|nr:serine/threonine-protein kinase [Brooklawnia sp. SH051]
MKCRQPGCTGTIVDGYCDVCGMPPAAGAAAPSRVNGSASAAAPAAGSHTPRRQFAAGSQPGQIRTEPPGPADAEPAAHEPAQQPPPASSGSSGRLGQRGGPCPQPGCRGTIVDGYCNVCGNPPDAKPPSATPKLLGTTLSTTATAAELGTVLMGSALAGPGAVRTSVRADAHRARTRIGAGVTTVPPAPSIDPAKAVLKDPVVPEARRNCPKCGAPVGRGHDGQPGKAVGTCEKCGTAFSFYPVIKPGELIAQQYEVAGAIAYGGMGWIYLARDRNVSDRWVVLKGLLNASDDDASAAAKSEKEFLAAVEHPLIVEIYNFVQHADARYIVMEYVPGRSITDLLKERKAANKGSYDPLPVDWALAYLIEILPAFTYLHEDGLLYCDFKPDNLMQVGDSVKLIDLGAVRRIADETSPIFGTVGYQAPEVAETGPSVASDIYTLGRALLVMSSEFRGYQSEYVDTLPPLSKMPLFAEHDSFYRLVQRACAPLPADRFQSAEDLRVQAMGVLREVVARRSPGAATTSAPSTLFSTPMTAGEGFDWRQLPRLLPDPADPMTSWIASITLEDPRQRMGALERAPQRTAQVMLTQIEIALGLGDRQTVSRIVRELLKSDPWDWRAIWMQGLLAFQTHAWHEAQAPFNTVYAQVPGELAPKFALAVACEHGEQLALAEELFAICASTDAAYVTPSAFAMTRIRLARDDREGALDALGLIPPTSRGYSDARTAQAQLVLQREGTLAELDQAWQAIHAARLDQITTTRLEAEVLEKALAQLHDNRGRAVGMFDGQPATERNLRPKLERVYRDLAIWTRDDDERRRLITQADSTRRWSLL